MTWFEDDNLGTCLPRTFKQKSERGRTVFGLEAIRLNAVVCSFPANGFLPQDFIIFKVPCSLDTRLISGLILKVLIKYCLSL